MFPNMASPPQLSVVYLRCAECGIGKTSSEEMEVTLLIYISTLIHKKQRGRE